MRGLDRLCNLLRRKNSVRVNHRIYCSEISKHFIVRKYASLMEKFVTVLADNAPRDIQVFDKVKESFYTLRVTGIPANHCPGSIMFLYETLDDQREVSYRILYTGDFRFESVPLSSLHSLHAPSLQDPTTQATLPLDELYLDTTFCHPQYERFPSREEALEELWKLVSAWIKKNGMYRKARAKHVVLLHLPGKKKPL